MPGKNQPSHVRLPQQSSEVIGPKPPLGQPDSDKARLDSRTITQDPALKPKGAGKTGKTPKRKR